MLVLPVVSQALAVVGKEDEDGTIVERLRLEEPDESPDDRVGRGDLSPSYRRPA